MNPETIRPLLRIKMLRADRAEEEQRRRRALLAAALGAAQAAERALQDWRVEMPRREEAIYAEVIGRVVSRDALDDVKERVVQLRAHERLLEQRLEDAQRAVHEAEKAAEEAAARALRARRDVSKFEEIIAVLRRAGLAEAERREDLELEEFARARDDEMEDGESDEWDRAA